MDASDSRTVYSPTPPPPPNDDVDNEHVAQLPFLLMISEDATAAEVAGVAEPRHHYNIIDGL